MILSGGPTCVSLLLIFCSVPQIVQETADFQPKTDVNDSKRLLPWFLHIHTPNENHHESALVSPLFLNRQPRTEVADGEMFDSSLLRGQGAEVYEMSEAVHLCQSTGGGDHQRYCIPNDNGDPRSNQGQSRLLETAWEKGKRMKKV